MPAQVLLIEDNPDNRELMIFLLRRAGHDVAFCERGPDGIEMARDSVPSVILLDLHMPGVDGYETARQIKADPELRHLPLVAVTAVAMVGDREAVLKHGFDGYIPKPITPETFAAEVAAYTLAPPAPGV
jgi:CheY-like chemotaxis protein